MIDDGLPRTEAEFYIFSTDGLFLVLRVNYICQ